MRVEEVLEKFTIMFNWVTQFLKHPLHPYTQKFLKTWGIPYPFVKIL
jgi:hypothetical protein